MIYLNGKEYASSYTSNGYSTISLRLYGPATINITFPQYHVYKVITISTNSDANVHEEFPTLQVSLIAIAIILIIISILKEVKSKRT
ncbi:hypothetical protein SULI_12825 [Saccharolobus solfataricus]|uniref:Uncharacterized protein n=1 Tax=Saccharolobus solfataricus TaxID=2287 RepID=A0A3G8DRX2_SACSO|nr:hypothetical protein [Saccharolobus solfataricus]AYN75620.1 hypothetical protein SULB_2530 [Saccharolobus solfataricus]AYN75782.1 hypothetical protein SULC_2525 [Saccharolobus solfataricus]AYP18617.1 hypothetical protein SULA_2527 [Saccharolobus solfataricus]AZF69117.1 hypothetical protein SULG_12825 [Saccharolobus solfataricus]AZF71737.1 hypothetical protein SULH_12825 [Saccharolobus solfataricus]